MAENNERLSFRATARMARMLGEHLIKDNTTGVLELIKNGYDADADNVRVELLDLREPSKTKVIVHDDGEGMDESVLRGPWSEPAHGDKQEAKNRLRRTAKGRLPLGEKGVGRFATQKLGRHLFMATRPRGSGVEYHVRIDWEDFDASGKYMDEIEFPMEKKLPPVVFTGESHGTRIEITGAASPWKKTNTEKLQTSLMRLLSPSGNIGNFSVVLKCPEHPELENLDKDDILERFQFKIDCSVDEKGFASYSYHHRQPDGTIQKQEKEGINLWSDASDQWEQVYPACGPFRIIIFAWLRGPANLRIYKLTGKELDVLSGISIYRDGFRIIPYGDPGDDWLKLDPRRTNSPGQKYGNNQIVGRVEILQDKNGSLIDKTSREGLQENQAFADMRNLVLATISRLEVDSREHRQREKKQRETVRELRDKVTDLQSTIENLQSELSKKPVQSADLDEGGENGKDGDTSKMVLVPREELENLKKKAEEVDDYIKRMAAEPPETEREKQEIFLHLVGVGMSAERFSHEFDRMVAAMSKNLETLERAYRHSSIRALRHSLDALKNEVVLMGAIRYVRKPPDDLQISVKDAVNLVLDINKDQIGKHGIKVDPPADDFTANMSTASLSQVLDNIVSNACYWLGKTTRKNERRICIKIYPNDRTVVVSNNGPFMAHNIKNRLFQEPFVTTKPDGRGLGLYISNEIIKDRGQVGLLQADDPRNEFDRVSFSVSLSERADRQTTPPAN